MSKELESLDYLYEMHKKYAPTVDIEGIKCMSKESVKWLDSIIILKRDYEKLKKVLEIIKEKGLSLNELWYIERNEPWSVYIEKMREVYFDDTCVEDGKLKTKEEYDLLKEVLL